jgi:cobalt-zinc-cadmium efflux system protein
MAYDALSSVVVIIGGVVILYTGWVIIDTLLSTVIALMIFWSSYLVIKEAVMILMEAVPPGINFDQVHDAIGSVPRISGVHDLHIWSLSSYETALSCHILLDEADYPDGPEIVASVDKLMHEQFGIGHCTLQVEVGDCDRSDILCRPNGNHSD